MIYEALCLAKYAHTGQVRKYTGDPYFYHPVRVAKEVMIHQLATQNMIAAALLHDVVEDTHISLKSITKEFGDGVGILVNELTNKTKGLKLPRAERKKLDWKRLATISKEAKIIKLIDRMDNLMEMKGANKEFLALYKAESIELNNVIGDADWFLSEKLSELIAKEV